MCEIWTEIQFQETQTQRDRRGGLEGWGPPGSACLSTHLGRCPAENQPHRIPCRSRVFAAYNSLTVVTTTTTIAVKLFFIAQPPVHSLVLSVTAVISLIPIAHRVKSSHVHFIGREAEAQRGNVRLGSTGLKPISLGS